MDRKMRPWVGLSVIAIIGFMAFGSGDHMFDKNIAAKKAEREVTVNELLAREPVEFIIRNGRGADDVINRAGFSHKENIKEDILEEVFWKINGCPSGHDRQFHPGEKVKFPLAKANLAKSR